jgi:hypothetical protein
VSDSKPHRLQVDGTSLQGAAGHEKVDQPARSANPWAAGIATAIALLMMMSGAFQVLQGMVAVLNAAFFQPVHDYAFELTATTWGWIQVVVGVISVVVGRFILRGDAWARTAGIALMVLSALASFLFIPYYPLWSLLLIPVDLLVIWALAAYRPE